MDNIRYFYGNDPARERDYHTIVIQGLLQQKTGGMKLPMLRDIYRFRGKDYLQVLNFLFNNLFKKYPPTKYALDYSRDPTWAELIRKKLGEEKTIEYKFTIDSKLHLMTIWRNYLLAGYKLPDVESMVRNHQITADKAQMIRELRQESLREQMKPTLGDKVSFSDGGKHNDLLHGQALSLKAVYEFTKNNSGFGRHSGFQFDGAVSELYEEETIKDKKTRMITKLMEGKGLFDKIDIKFS